MKVLVSMTDSSDAGVCRIVAVDLGRGVAEMVFEWLPPPSLCTSGRSFLGIEWLGAPGKSDLVACGYSALCRIDCTTWTVNGVLHQPCMNDLHHVAIHDGRLLVANTGLERIDTFDMSGQFTGGWDLSPAWVAAQRMAGCNPSREGWLDALQRTWEPRPGSLENVPITHENAAVPAVSKSMGLDRTDPSLPFHNRKTRHFIHPNHIAVVTGRPLVTRFIDCSVQDLSDWSFAIPKTPGHPHDGIVCDERFWITCTSGLIVAYAMEDGRVTSREVERIDIPERTGHSGWCRGLVITEELMIVGLTTMQYMPPFGWSDRDFSKTETSILAIDRRTLKLVARVDLRQFGKLPKMFGIVELPATAAASSVASGEAEESGGLRRERREVVVTN